MAMHAWRIAAAGETPRCRGWFRAIDTPLVSRRRQLLAHLEGFLPAVWFTIARAQLYAWVPLVSP